MPMAFDTVYDLTRSTEAATVAASYLIFGKYKVAKKQKNIEPNNRNYS